ncbi:Methionyl-tRNA formyltransferase [Buchnera aphidicola (Thelaxes suberi)]|uniref:methionyl-tRNA formyltransferase n=1 Tax=Buchnera aphidicola TaxID=9 RepID=UPI0034642828
MKKKEIDNLKNLKIIFSGNGDFAETHLKYLIDYQYNIVAIITQKKIQSKRGKKKKESSISILAKKNKIILLELNHFNDPEQLKTIETLKANIMVVVSYGVIFPDSFLNMFHLGCINVHASILPRWRGPSPIQSAILAGDETTGVTTIYMKKKVDAGPIINTLSCPIEQKDNYDTLYKKLSLLGAQCLLQTIKKIIQNKVYITEQNPKKITYSQKILKQNGKINWSYEAQYIERMIRAFYNWPIPFFIYKNRIIKIRLAKVELNLSNKKPKIGEIIEITKNGIKVQTIKNILNIQLIQFSGKKTITILDFLNANKHFFVEGEILH